MRHDTPRDDSGSDLLRMLPRLIVGSAVLLAGVALTLDAMGLTDWDLQPYWRLWPLVLVMVGAAMLLQPRGRGFGLLLAVVGSGLLLDRLGYIDFNFNLIFPLLVLTVGGAILWQALKRPQAPADDDDSSTVSLFAVPGGVKRKVVSPAFRGGSATAILGGCELDLHQAGTEGDGAVIDAFALMGGVDLLVPPEWEVVVEGSPLLGGFEDQRRPAPPLPGAPPPPRLVVKGTAILGAVEVK